ncbi:hypothetical protein [Jeotgalibacillus sp. S-D1]|nr:hypothetical protein [Jeotgalibacillus sp. S-D1]
MENAASIFVDLLVWIGVAVILFIVFAVALLLKLRESNRKKNHPTDKRER